MKLVLVPWNANGAGGRDWDEMLELSGEVVWIEVLEFDRGAARDRVIWSINTIRHPQNIP